VVIEKMGAIRRSENKRVCFMFMLEIEGCDCFTLLNCKRNGSWYCKEWFDLWKVERGRVLYRWEVNDN